MYSLFIDQEALIIKRKVHLKEISQQLKMLNEYKTRIEYLWNRCLYYISLSSSQTIIIKVEHIDQKKEFTVVIDNKMSQVYNLNIHQLYDQIYKQHLYQSSKPKTMILCQNHHVVIRFDFPKSKIKSIQFYCQEQSREQLSSNIKIITDLAQSKIKAIQSSANILINKITETIELKSSQFSKIIQMKLQKAVSTFDTELNKKLAIFQQFYDSKQAQYQEECRQQLARSVCKLFQDNGRYLNEFHLIKSNLQENISILHSNIKEGFHNIQQLQQELQYYKEWHQQELRKIILNNTAKHQQFQKNIRRIDKEIERIALSQLLPKTTKFEDQSSSKQFIAQLQNNLIIDQKRDFEISIYQQPYQEIHYFGENQQ